MEFFKLSRPKRLFVLLLIAYLGGCAWVKPYVDRRREAGISDPDKLYIGLSKPDKPAICYNKWASDYAEVKKLADEECVKQKTGSHAEPVEQKIMSCKLFTPNHFIFKCVGTPPSEPANTEDFNYEENTYEFIN